MITDKKGYVLDPYLNPNLYNEIEDIIKRIEILEAQTKHNDQKVIDILTKRKILLLNPGYKYKGDILFDEGIYPGPDRPLILENPITELDPRPKSLARKIKSVNPYQKIRMRIQ